MVVILPLLTSALVVRGCMRCEKLEIIVRGLLGGKCSGWIFPLHCQLASRSHYAAMQRNGCGGELEKSIGGS